MSLVNSVVAYGSAHLLVTGHNPTECVCLLLSSEGEECPDRTVLHHGRAIRLPLEQVHKIADSLEEYATIEKARRRAYKLKRTVCENESGVKGVVTGCSAGTFTGRALTGGDAWESKHPRMIADSLHAYTEILINKGE
jgi:hypothetical protein